VSLDFRSLPAASCTEAPAFEAPMVIASQLRPGTVLKINNDLFKVIDSQYHIGQGKMPGSVHAKLRNVLKGTFKELRFRPEEQIEETQLEKHEMEFLYSDADSATFMNPRTYDQVSIPLEAIGAVVPVEVYQGQPVSIVFPEIVEVKIRTTAQPVHQQQDNTYKSATLENGGELMVPQFIKPGETIRVEVASGKYVDRVRTDAKRF
jgi:elongation factor P